MKRDYLNDFFFIFVESVIDYSRYTHAGRSTRSRRDRGRVESTRQLHVRLPDARYETLSAFLRDHTLLQSIAQRMDAQVSAKSF